MLPKSGSLILILLLFLGFLVPQSGALLAQELVRISEANISEGITLELNTEALTSSTNFLAVGDTSNQMLMLTNLTVNDQNIWLKKSDEEVVNSNNAVHWYYNEEAQILFVNLTGIKDNFTPGANL